MFELQSDIKIGKFRFDGVHEVRVKKSILNYMDTAIIKLPATYRLLRKGNTEAEPDLKITAQQFKRGDEVRIKLGYNGALETEFEGYVSRVNGGRPCEIECEGFSFLLREKRVNKSYRKTTLKEVLSEIVKDTDVVLSKDIPDIGIDKINMAVLSGQSSNGVPLLDTLKKALGGILFINFDGKTLYAGLGYTKTIEALKPLKADVVYRMGRNAISDSLKERVKGDKTIVVFASAKRNDGTYLSAKSGDGDAGVQRIRVPHVQDAAGLKVITDAKESVENYSGLEGSVTAFLQPFCKPGQKMKFIDPQNSERNTQLIIDTVEVHFSTSGARRIPQASHAL